VAHAPSVNDVPGISIETSVGRSAAASPPARPLTVTLDGEPRRYFYTAGWTRPRAPAHPPTCLEGPAWPARLGLGESW